MALPRLALLVLVPAVALAGCVSISEESARQLDDVGDVELTTVICASETAVGPRCPASDSTELDPSGTYQVLIGYRLPAQAAPPESIVAVEPVVTLSRSSSYTAELQRLAAPPASAAQRWVGYVSPPFEHRLGDSSSSATIVARVGLLRAADGTPFGGPFHYRTIVGYREAGEDPNRPVQCGEPLNFRNDAGDTTCMTYPDDSELPTNATLQTRDLGIVAGPPGAAPRGGTGIVHFKVAYSGDGASPPFALVAGTTVPGGSAAPSVGEIAPAASGTTVVPVTVQVPASTPRDSYEVTLTATHANGQQRHAGGLIAVTGADAEDRTPPELAARMRTTPRLRRARRIGVVADVSCSEECTLTSELRAGPTSARALGLPLPPGQRAVVVGSAAERNAASGRRNVRIRFRKGLGPRMLQLRRLSLSMRVTARDRAGNTRRRSIQFSLRR